MTSFPEQGSASIEINAAPEVVWNLVADITRMSEYSPECVHAGWEGEATGPAVGAHFQGKNKIGDFEWEVPCAVTESEAGRVFAFKALRDSEVGTAWRYEFASSGDGTTVTESVNAPLINVEGSPSNFDGRHAMIVEGMKTTLAAIKAVAEA
jgi:Polyketide cyclase / dehydrase and lipid transport.